jgi:uncharacterized protein (TIGR00369 family)
LKTFDPRDEDFVNRIGQSFARQAFMATLGAKLTSVKPGEVEIQIPYQKELTQQHGFFHGGVVGTVADNAGGYAAGSLMAAKDSILTVEYKLNLMAPAKGDTLIARGYVVRPGRNITTCRADVFITRDGIEHLCATMLGTFMTMHDTSDEPATV